MLYEEAIVVGKILIMKILNAFHKLIYFLFYIKNAYRMS